MDSPILSTLLFKNVKSILLKSRQCIIIGLHFLIFALTRTIIGALTSDITKNNRTKDCDITRKNYILLRLRMAAGEPQRSEKTKK